MMDNIRALFVAYGWQAALVVIVVVVLLLWWVGVDVQSLINGLGF